MDARRHVSHASEPGASARASAILAASALAWAGVLGALYLTGAWVADWPGGWSLRRRFDPAHERAARDVAAHARERLALFAREPERDGAIVFLGSSTIERMPLAELFPGRPCVNRGIARASVPLLSELLPRLVPRARCSGFVIYAGSIDWREGGAGPAEVAQRVEQLLTHLADLEPHAPVALLGILPDRTHVAGREVELIALDLCLAGLARRVSSAERPVAFVRTAREPLSSPTLRLSEAYSSDDLHLDGDGYRILARWILEDGGAVARALAP